MSIWNRRGSTSVILFLSSRDVSRHVPKISSEYKGHAKKFFMRGLTRKRDNPIRNKRGDHLLPFLASVRLSCKVVSPLFETRKSCRVVNSDPRRRRRASGRQRGYSREGEVGPFGCVGGGQVALVCLCPLLAPTAAIRPSDASGLGPESGNAEGCSVDTGRGGRARVGIPEKGTEKGTLRDSYYNSIDTSLGGAPATAPS